MLPSLRGEWHEICERDECEMAFRGSVTENQAWLYPLIFALDGNWPGEIVLENPFNLKKNVWLVISLEQFIQNTSH